MHLFPILGLFNLASERGKGVPCSHQIVAWYSGLRGAIAVALAYQVVGPNAHVIRAATMFVVVGTTFLFGGSTKCLLDCLKIPTGCAQPADDDDEHVVPGGGSETQHASRWKKFRTIFLAFKECLVDRREEAFHELPKESRGPHEA